MRMSQALYSRLRQSVEPHMPLDAANSQRARWDALSASKFDTRELYAEGLNDAHIDTALKKIATFSLSEGGR